MVGFNSPWSLAGGYLRSKYQQGHWPEDIYEANTKVCSGVVDFHTSDVNVS